MYVSERLANMQESPIRKLIPYAEYAKSMGRHVYHLNIGQPDIETPASFMDAVRQFDDKVLAYAPSQGIPELISSIIDYYKIYNLDFDNEEILITYGGSEALLFSILAITDPDDEILIPEPYYTNFSGFCQMVNTRIIPITCKAENGFRLPNKFEIEGLIKENTKGILLSNPGNPTGAVYTREELKMLGKLAKKHNLYIICDEAYREFVYDDFEFTSFASIKEIADRVIIVDSISKRYSACGARVGCIASKNKKIMKEILKLCQSRLCVPVLEQIGATELYKTPKNYFNTINKEYRKRRDIVYNALKDIPGIVCEKPSGAFYIMAKLPVDDAEKFATWLLQDFQLDNSTVMITPACDFYASPNMGTNEVRIAYTLQDKDLVASMNILKIALNQYNK